MVVAPRWTGLEAAALRKARRMSVRAYAAHLGVSAATVANWDNRGELARLNTETQQMLDIDLERAPDDVQQRFTSAFASESQGVADGTSTEGPVNQTEVIGEAEVSSHAPQLVAAGIPADADADLVELTAVLERRGISSGALISAELAGERLDQRFARLGTVETLTRVRLLMTSVVSQMNMPQPLRHQRRLVALIARLAGLRAWGCFDLDQLGEAERWYDVAVSAAQDAEAWSLGAWLLGAQSLVPWHRRDRQSAVAIIERGIYFAGRGSDSTTVAWLHALHARGRASLGDSHGFDTARELAEEAADHSSERDRRHGMDFHEGVLDLRYYEGTSRLLLAQPDSAATSLRGSLESLPPTHTKARAVLTIALADAAVQSDDLHQAVNLTRGALAATSSQPIMPILQQARRIRRQVSHRDPGVANELDDDLHQFAGALAAASSGAAL
jgi:transcriptional regulator with XRE-family HTH domain